MEELEGSEIPEEDLSDDCYIESSVNAVTQAFKIRASNLIIPRFRLRFGTKMQYLCIGGTS